MAKYLDNDGLLYLWQKIKSTFAKTTDLPSASSTTPSMDGTASSGSSSDYARADHAHPTDTSRAPVSHASAETTYGSGTSSNYGHVKLSDSTSSTTAAASGGTAATPKAVKDALDAAKAYADGKADTNTTYGISKDGSSIILTGSDGSTTNVTDSDTTDLTEMTGTLGVSHGGTGATTLTGIVKGNGTSAMTAATASDVVSLLGATPVNRATADAAGANIADTYAKKTDIAGVYKYKGSVAAEANLPSTGQTTGDVYNIESASSYGAAGANVAWNGTAWDSLGEIFAISSITNAEIDIIVAS